MLLDGSENIIKLHDLVFERDNLIADADMCGGNLWLKVEQNDGFSVILLSPKDANSLAKFIQDNFPVSSEELKEQIGLLDALGELKKGNKVEVVFGRESTVIGHSDDLNDLWCGFVDNIRPADLLDATFYKESV